MALAGDRPRDREPFSKQQERGRLDYDDYRDSDRGVAVLFHPSFNPGIRESLLPPDPPYCDRNPMAFEISKRMKAEEG